PVSSKSEGSLTDPKEKIISSLLSTVDRGIRELKEVRKLPEHHRQRYQPQLELLGRREKLLGELKELAADKFFWKIHEKLTEIAEPKSWHWYVQI
ncbi:MAG: hypothetical protein ACRENF_05040, partial [Thermodesulfobacteriota bacterium]